MTCYSANMLHALERIQQAAVELVTQQTSIGTVAMKHQFENPTEPLVRRTGRWTVTVFILSLLSTVLLVIAGCTSDAERPYENRDRWDRQSTTDWQDY